MSVWCSSLSLDDEPGRPPLVYRESHVLPSADDPRGGELSLAYIPGFVTRDGRDDDAEDERCWPYLRVSLRSPIPDEDTVVLDLAQWDALIADLVALRARVREELA